MNICLKVWLKLMYECYVAEIYITFFFLKMIFSVSSCFLEDIFLSKIQVFFSKFYK